MNSSNPISRLTIPLLAVLLILSVVSGLTLADAGEPGYLMVDGQKTFPMGWFKLGATETNSTAFSLDVLNEGPPHGFDYAMHYYPWPPHGVGLLNWMDEAYARGMKVMVHLWPLSSTYPTWTSMVNAVKDHPALYGYYLEDEPDSRGIDVAYLQAKYDEVKAADPCHLIFTTYVQGLGEIIQYLAATDVALRELYWMATANSIANDAIIARIRGKGYMVCPRAFDDPSWPTFTAEEFRYLTFSAVVDGAGGIMPFIFEGYIPGGSPLPNYKENYIYPTTDIVAAITGELEMGLTDGLQATSPAFEANNGRYIFSGNNESAVLIAVNHGPTLADATFEVNGLSSDITEVVVIGESRTIPFTGPGNNQFIDSFAAIYGVHIYLFKTPCEIIWDNGQGLAADTNRDCHVNWLDFLSIAESVDWPDIVALAEQWLECYNPDDPVCSGL